MRGGALDRRYARALFGMEAPLDRARALLEEVDDLCQEIEASPELVRALFTPLFPRHERRAVIRELVERLDHSTTLRSFAALLVDQNRAQHLPGIRDELRRLVETAEGRVEARVTSARPLGDAEAEGVRRALSERVGATVTLTLDVDPSLIGGLVARVGDLLLDGSVRTQLASLAESLRRGSA